MPNTIDTFRAHRRPPLRSTSGSRRSPRCSRRCGPRSTQWLETPTCARSCTEKKRRSLKRHARSAKSSGRRVARLRRNV